MRAGSRRPPRLSIEIDLEQPALIAFVASTYEDELRLRSWLQRTPQVGQLSEIVVRMLDDFDRADEAAA